MPLRFLSLSNNGIEYVIISKSSGDNLKGVLQYPSKPAFFERCAFEYGLKKKSRF